MVFVRTDENDADLFTKNLSSDKYKKHSDKLVGDKGTILALLMEGGVFGGILSLENEQMKIYQICMGYMKNFNTKIYYKNIRKEIAETDQATKEKTIADKMSSMEAKV